MRIHGFVFGCVWLLAASLGNAETTGVQSADAVANAAGDAQPADSSASAVAARDWVIAADVLLGFGGGDGEELANKDTPGGLASSISLAWRRGEHGVVLGHTTQDNTSLSDMLIVAPIACGITGTCPDDVDYGYTTRWAMYEYSPGMFAAPGQRMSGTRFGIGLAQTTIELDYSYASGPDVHRSDDAFGVIARVRRERVGRYFVRGVGVDLVHSNINTLWQFGAYLGLRF